MENLQYSKILKRNWDIVALIMGIAVVLSLIVCLFLPFQYEASTQILIIQKQELNTDAYTATKSAERIGKNLTNIINTSSFYNEVINSNIGVADKFSADTTERRKEWKKNVEVNVLPETGILEIKVYDIDRDYASQLVRTIAYVLVNKGAEYHGGGSNVEIKVVDDVFMSKYPVRPNIIVNTILALMIGFILGSVFVILNEAKRLNTKVYNAYSPNINSQYSQESESAYEDSYEMPIEEEMPDKFEAIDADAPKSRKTVVKTMHDHLHM